MKRKILFQCIRDVIRISPSYVLYVFFNLIVMTIMPFIYIRLIASVFDHANKLIENQENSLLFYIICFLIFIFANKLIDAFNLFISNIVLSRKMNYKFSQKLLDHVSQISLENFEQSEFYSTMQRAQACVNNGNMTNLFSIIFFSIPQIFTIFGLISVVGMYNKWLIILALLSVIPSFFANLSANKQYYRMIRYQSKKQRARDYLWGLFFNKESMREMHIHKFDDYLEQKWISVRNEVLDEEIKIKGDASIKVFWGDVIKTGFYGLCLGVCIYLAVKGLITIGVLGACFIAFLNLQNTAQGIVASFANIDDNINYLQDYYDTLSIPVEDNIGKIALEKIDIVEANNVSYKYADSTIFACKNISLTINRNEKVAIVGENGSGKTTLLKLLIGMYPLHSGNVSYNKIDINEIDKNSLYKLISLIQQNFTKLKTTIKDNIDFGEAQLQESISNDDLKNLLKTCGAEDLENIDFNAQVGREFDGYEFSGGQWQKIAIARAVAKKYDLIMLDEPTASLDPILEQNILKKFIDITLDKTAIIVSHRLGICRFVNKIIVLKEGEVVEIGNHSELLSSNGYYASMWQEQSKWYKD